MVEEEQRLVRVPVEGLVHLRPRRRVLAGNSQGGGLAHFGIGLRDQVCPPSTGFAAYNQYGAGNGRPAGPERDLHVYPFNGHEGGEAVQVRRQLRWLAGVLGH